MPNIERVPQAGHYSLPGNTICVRQNEITATVFTVWLRHKRL